MKKLTMYMCVCVLAISSLFANEYDELLKKVDNLISFAHTDLSAEYTIVTKEPSGAISQTKAAMFRRDKKEQFTILVLEPAINKGKGYLKDQGILWLYDPADNSFTTTSTKNRFQNTSIYVSDFSPINYSKNYTVDKAQKQQLGKFNCTVLDLTATNNSVTYDKTKIWVSEDNLIRKIEDYSLSGQIMRTIAIPTYQKVLGKWIPKTMVIEDHLMYQTINNKKVYQRTIVTIENPAAKDLPNIIYTKEYLQQAR